MVKAIGFLLIVSSLFLLIMGAFLDYRNSAPGVSGNAISQIENVKLGGTAEYFEAAILSFSIISLIMGLMFLIRV